MTTRFHVDFQVIGGEERMGYTPREWPTKAANDRDELLTLAESGVAHVNRLLRDMEHRQVAPIEVRAGLLEVMAGCERAARICERQGARLLPKHETVSR